MITFGTHYFSKEGISEFINERSEMYLELAKRLPCELNINIYHDNTDPASKTYVRNKLNRFAFYGIIPRETDNAIVFNDWAETKKAPTFIQQPYNLTKTLEYTKDCEGLAYKDIISQTQKQGYFSKAQTLWPCTAKGIFEHLEWTLKRSSITDKPHVVIVGRSELVGKPLARLLLANDYTVTVMHSKTPSFSKEWALNTADVIVSATGNRGWLGDLEDKITSTPVYDVGINFENGHLCGDIVNPTNWCTPVPGGVGRLTVEALCWNIIDWYYRQIKI